MTAQPATIITVAEYEGQEDVRIRATQLGTGYTASAARRVVQDWVDLLSAGTSPIRRLEFTSRTPSRLFEALAGQRQLQSLSIKWGDYADLSPLSEMSELQQLSLRGAAKVTVVERLAGLTSLSSLVIEGFRQIEDPSPLGGLRDLTSLELGGNWMTPKNGRLPSIAFLRELHGIRDLLLHTLVVDDRDYSPLMDLPQLQRVRVMKVQGMVPTFEELKATLPWDG